jgi:hypothetical protein
MEAWKLTFSQYESDTSLEKLIAVGDSTEANFFNIASKSKKAFGYNSCIGDKLMNVQSSGTDILMLQRCPSDVATNCGSKYALASPP